MNLGINVVEVDGRAAPSVQGASTSVAGFVIRSMRGVPHVVRQVTSYRQFVEYFGDVMDGAFGAFAIRGFFDNGGTLAYVLRAVGGGTPASRAFTGNGATVLTVSTAYLGRDDPGTWGNKLVGISIERNADDGTFNLVVWQKGPTANTQLERWDRLAIDGIGSRDPRQINDEVAGSKYIKVAVADGAATNPDATMIDTRKVPLPASLEGGTDDNAAAADQLFLAAFNDGVFDPYDVQLLCCPESASQPLAAAALDYCERRGDCMFIGHTSQDERDNVSAARAYGSDNPALHRAKAYGALYFPFIRVADPRGGTRWIPPTGHVMGVYARTERERGIWKAPAGNAAHLNGALDVWVAISDTQHTELVKKGGVNAVRFIAGQGIVIDSSRTMSTDVLWLYVNVRLLFNYVKSSLKAGLRWVAQEPNDPALWAKVKYNTVTPFLMGLWRRGAFGPGAAKDVFTVKVDADNNPPENVKQGIFNVEVYFYPSRPAETIIITVGQQDGSATTGER